MSTSPLSVARLARAILLRVALVATGVLVALTLAEVAIRVVAQFNAPVRYLVALGVDRRRPTFGTLEAYLDTLRPAITPHRDILNFWTNSLGLYDEEFETPKPPNRLRIMALGDSFTFGSVAYPDSVTTRVEEALRASCPSLGFDLLNFGIPGADVWDYKTLAELGVPRFGPTLVVLNVYLGNDGPDLYVPPSIRPLPPLTPRRLHLVRYVRNLARATRHVERRPGANDHTQSMDQASPRGGSMVNPAAPLAPGDSRLMGPTFSQEAFVEVMWDELRRFAWPPLVEAPDARWQPTLAVLDLVRHFVTREGRFAIAIYPSVLQVYPDRRATLLEELRKRPRLAPQLPAKIDPELPSRILLDYCRRAGISCLDLTPTLAAAAKDSPEPLYKERDTHWTARGNRVAADAQARWLRRLVCR